MTTNNSGGDIWLLVADRLAQGGDRPAWIMRNKRAASDVWTYQQILNAIAGLTRQFQDRALKRGDIVGLMAPNGPYWASAALALWRMGVVVAPIHIGNSDSDIAAQIRSIDPVCVLRFDTDRDVDRLWNITLDLNAIRGPALPLPDYEPLPEVHEATRIYTSGSTGSPKVVRLSHQNMTSNVLASQTAMDIRETDRFLSLLPLSHAYEMTGGLLLALSRGASTVVPHTLAANEVLAALAEEQVSLMIAVPRLFRNIMQGLDKKLDEGGPLLRAYVSLIRWLPQSAKALINRPLLKKFGRARCWASGGSGLDPSILAYFQALGIDLRQGYGLTETSPVISVQEKFDSVREGVGRPLPGTDVKIHQPDEEGRGELWVRGPNVMLGYTDDSLTDQIVADGWLNTGDLARLTDDGRIVLTGRSKRLIVTEAGKNVYPEEVEVLLERFSDIAEAGVIEVDMKPVAILAMQGEQQEQRARGVLKQFNRRTSAHNRIMRFALTDELPRTPLGKIALTQLPVVFASKEVRDE